MVQNVLVKAAQRIVPRHAMQVAHREPLELDGRELSEEALNGVPLRLAAHHDVQRQCLDGALDGQAEQLLLWVCWELPLGKPAGRQEPPAPQLPRNMAALQPSLRGKFKDHTFHQLLPSLPPPCQACSLRHGMMAWQGIAWG